MALPFSLWGVISARWSAIQASQAVDVDGSRAKLTKLHCYNMLQQLASPTNEAQFFLENCEAMRILWPWHDRHDIAWNILKQSCSFNSFQVLMEVGIPVHFNFDGDAMLLELQAKLQGDFERHGRNTMPFKNCDRELQFVANNTSDLHWTFFRALSIAVDTFNILQQSSAFRNCRLGAAAPHRNPTEVHSLFNGKRHAFASCWIWPSLIFGSIVCAYIYTTGSTNLRTLAKLVKVQLHKVGGTPRSRNNPENFLFNRIRWFYLGQPIAFLHHPCFQQTKKTRDRLILAFCSSLQEAGVQVKNTMETVCVWRAISEQHAHSALELFEISSRELWSINQFLICCWTKLALTFPRRTNRTMKHPENTIEY